MELRQLRYFSVLAEELNFTRAAERLNISQPPLSVQIAQLEDELQVQLFERSSRRVALTEAGRVFQQGVGNVFGHLQDAVTRTKAVEQGLAGHIDVGLSGSHFLGPLPELIRRYADRYPEVAVVLHEMQPSQHLDALRRGRLDVSVSRTSVDDDMLFSSLLWHDPVVAVLPQGHPLLRRRALRLADLRDAPFVLLRPETSIFAQQLYSACSAAGFLPKAAQHVAEIPAQLRLVSAGLGVALVPTSTCGYVDRVVVRPLLGDLPHGAVYAVRRRQPHRAVLDSFLAQAREMAAGSQSADA